MGKSKKSKVRGGGGDDLLDSSDADSVASASTDVLGVIVSVSNAAAIQTTSQNFPAVKRVIVLRDARYGYSEFLNAPNGASHPAVAGNGRQEADSPQSPLGSKTDVLELPFHMARDQIEESLRTKKASIKLFKV